MDMNTIQIIGAIAAVISAAIGFIILRITKTEHAMFRREHFYNSHPNIELSGQIEGLEYGRLRYRTEISNVSDQIARIRNIEFSCFFEDPNNNLLYYTLPIMQRVGPNNLSIDDNPLSHQFDIDINHTISQNRVTVSAFISYLNRYDEEHAQRVQVSTEDITDYLQRLKN
jgi:hypothetical protein